MAFRYFTSGVCPWSQGFLFLFGFHVCLVKHIVCICIYLSIAWLTATILNELFKKMSDQRPLRAKIDAIIRKNEAVPAEDAPDDPASTRFWSFVGGKYTDRERVSVKGTAVVGVKATPGGIAALLDGGAMPGSGTLGAPTTPSTVTLSSLVGLAKEAPAAAAPKAKAKAKGKAKAKAKEPQTTKEKKDVARTPAEFYNRCFFFGRTKPHVYIYIT